MANFSNNVMTDVGRVMFGDVQMGATLIPTKIVIGSGRIPSGKTARTMTDVATPVVDLTITKKQKSNDGTAIFGGVYSNENVSTDFYFRELALYAKAGEDGEEVLFSYGNAGEAADYMPAYTSGTPVQRQIDLAVYIGNDTQVDMTIADGVYVTMDQLETELNAALTDKIGQPDGIASLDSTGKVPSSQLPAMDYIPTSEKGAASGVATLDSSGKIPSTQLPDSVGEDIAALGKELHDWWVYASDTMAYTCVTPADTSTKPYSYVETVRDAEGVAVATLMTTCNADGSYTESLARGDVVVTRTWTKSGNTYERGVWTKWMT